MLKAYKMIALFFMIVLLCSVSAVPVLADSAEDADKIDDIEPTYDKKQNKIVVPEVEGYKTEIDGVDFEQIVNKDFEVQQPLTEKKVNISLKITNTSTDEVTTTDDFEVSIPGKHKKNEGQDKPSVSPELAEWYSDSNDVFTANSDSRIVIDEENNDALQDMAKEFKKDYQDITGKSINITYGTDPKKGDFYFTLDADDSFLGEEGYHMTIDDQVTVEAQDKVGAYWSTRSILQIMNQSENKDEIPYGETRDYPKYEVRSFMLDVARRPYSMEGLEDIAKNMAWHKMNDFQVHLNDNYIFLEDYGVDDTEEEALNAYSAFRLESDVTNEDGESPTAEDYAYSKQEFKDFMNESEEIGVDIVPEIDVPAHANAITQTFPEFMVENETSPVQDDRPLVDHIDISNPEAVSKVKDIFDDYTKGSDPVFDHDTVVHIGADEFLSDYTAYREFINDFVPYMKDTNTVRMWGGLSWIKDDPVTEIDKDAIEDVQLNLWSKDWADGKEMYDMGYQLINTIDSYMYMVPDGSGSKGAYGDYLDTNALFDNFEPNLLATESGWESIPSGSDQLSGAAFAIWNDNTDKRSSGLTETDIYQRFQDALPVIAEKTWANGKEKESLDHVQSVSEEAGLAPNSNPLMEEKATDGEYASYTFEENNETKDSSENSRDLSNLTNASFEKGKSANALKLDGEESYIETPLDKLGDGNTLSFDLKLSDASSGDILFEEDSPYGTHDIRIMDDGKLGFTRELHDYTFDYKVPTDEWVHISIKTSNLETALYVDDEFKGKAEGTFIHNDTVKKEGIKNSTFSLPLKRIGSTSNAVKGKLDNIVLSRMSAKDIKERVERYKQAGEIENDQTAHELTMHLTAVNRYEEQNQDKKVVKHMKGFKTLLDHQEKDGEISEGAYDSLMENASDLMEGWK